MRKPWAIALAILKLEEQVSKTAVDVAVARIPTFLTPVDLESHQPFCLTLGIHACSLGQS